MPSTQRIPAVLTDFAADARARGCRGLRLLRSLELECQTREEAEHLADVVAALLPEPARSRFGLIELMLNGIEHGNLEIGSALKAQLLREHRFADEVASRLARESYRARRIHIKVMLSEPLIDVEIRDDGPGFDWRPTLAAELPIDDSPSGRGIALVRTMCFTTLAYRDPGNVAVVRLPWPR
jgi:hypothetical protein